MLLDRTNLPKVGFLYVFTTADGRRAGVVAHRSGRRDLVLYDPLNPDRVRCTVVLTGAEPRTLAELLGLPVVIDHVPHLIQGLTRTQAAGLQAVRIPLAAASPYCGRTLGDTRAQDRTGASIVAVLRDGRTITSLPPGFHFRQGDAVVAVGDTTATTKLRNLLVNGRPTD
ncbi:cation:proton antiporter regulatory subunit [Actinomadura alba]|uniref:Cation:proton antiporter regulatory subunit n=1 Tax=Actinomadura alba TaxID=406431 RepID=A0ABR7M014_9ACTN|nr:cation:proton antiporter regulatory subunit [Actinomadura alba]MBC6469963.1 cation:proton antiporter regulatory subunit [Actinomadura alba]